MRTDKIKWTELITGILLILLGIYSLIRPVGMLTGVTVIYGLFPDLVHCALPVKAVPPFPDPSDGGRRVLLLYAGHQYSGTGTGNSDAV